MAKMKKITKVTQISKKFVKDFYSQATTTTEQKEWIKSKIKEAENKDRQHWFTLFRLEFAHEFFPELFKKRDFIDELAEIDLLLANAA